MLTAVALPLLAVTCAYAQDGPIAACAEAPGPEDALALDGEGGERDLGVPDPDMGEAGTVML